MTEQDANEDPTRCYFATTRQFPDGHVFPVSAQPSKGHTSRMEGDDRWVAMEEKFEATRQEGEHSRATAYYVSGSVGECGLYMQRQMCDPVTGEQTNDAQIHYYEVEMPNPTRCVMKLCDRATEHAANEETVDGIAAEYWRQEKYKWDYFEYLDETMTIIREVEPPTEAEINIANEQYLNDTIRSRNIWPAS